MLPFAIGNGICAGAGYAALDAVFGSTSKILRNPFITGGGIGAFTGLVAPSFLYGPIYSILYGVNGVSEAITTAFTTFPFFAQISCATGFAAGIAMYPMLHYPMFGIQGVPWMHFSGVLLLASGVTIVYLYSADNDHVMPMPDGAFVDPKMVPLLDSIIRYNVESGEFGTYSLTANEWVGSPDRKELGQGIAESVRRYKRNYSYHTFDNQILSLLCMVLDSSIADRYQENLVHVKDVKELQSYEDAMFRSDWVVEFIIGGSKDGDNNGPRDTSITNIDEKADKMLMYGSAMNERERKRRIKSIETTSIGAELLMTLRLAEKKSMAVGNKNVPSMVDLENWVRKRAPSIVLYKNEEFTGLQGQSVESQLERMDWKAPALCVALDKWEDLRKQERGSKIRNGLIITISGLLASVGMLLSN